MAETVKNVKKNETSMPKYVYIFSEEKSEGDASYRNLLGGKGANLAEMCKIGLPVPAGFTVSTECCTDYFANGGKFPESLYDEVKTALAEVEKFMGRKYGDAENPLLFSCRSGARQSMPGMMDTVLNLGLSSETIPGLIKSTQNERFVWDSYRRLIMMYADVVMEKAEGIEPAEGEGIRSQLENMLEAHKEAKSYKEDNDLTADDLRELSSAFKVKIKEVLGKDFPDDPMEQLYGGIDAVFKSWNGQKAISYRRIEGIPDDWGTAVNVQVMAFGNMGKDSGTGVAFTRNPSTGANEFFGEWLQNAQGEDVVAGIRTPNPLNEETKNEQNEHMPSMQELWPEIYQELLDVRQKLEEHYKDMQDVEFTIENGKLYMLQCRSGKRSGKAAINIALDMLDEGLVDEKAAILSVQPDQVLEFLLPIIEPNEESKAEMLVKGLPAGPGASCGQIYFTNNDAVQAERAGKKVILVREETNPEDVEGMRASAGILTSRGGMTSHAALVARGWGKCCIVGAADLQIDAVKKIVRVGETVLGEGDYLTLNGTNGAVYAGQLPLVEPTAGADYSRFTRFMDLVDKYRTMGVRANADTAADAKKALSFGAEGIGLFRTEHMFYEAGSTESLFLLRKMILCVDTEDRIAVLDELFPAMKDDLKDTMAVMGSAPVTVRLLDPPLHEFVPHSAEGKKELADALGIAEAEVNKRVDALVESNPMMGHRGVRLSVTYPEITEYQVRAILQASAELLAEGQKLVPEIMIPITCDVREFEYVKQIVVKVHEEVKKAFNLECFDYKLGTMIEIPRAALLAGQLARSADFFSFGTNDLTQMTYGFSRDDTGAFMLPYMEEKILSKDPFQTIDTEGVGILIKMATDNGKLSNPELTVGICGEQGGDAASVEFCYNTGLTYVSCSPFRVPVARVAAAQAAIKAAK